MQDLRRWGFVWSAKTLREKAKLFLCPAEDVGLAVVYFMAYLWKWYGDEAWLAVEGEMSEDSEGAREVTKG